MCAEQTSDLLNIIHEDGRLLVVNKPAGLVCHPTKGDEYSSLIGRARLHLGNGLRPHLVNRLDRETSGVTIIAKNPETAGELGRLWEAGDVKKEYHAIVYGHPNDDHGLIEAPLGKDEQSQVAVKDCVRSDGAPSLTEYWVEKRFSRAEGNFALLRIAPLTGRKHQIRIHLAHIGHSVVGDKLYGGDEDLYLALVQDRLTEEQRHRLILPNQALHAASIQFHWRGAQIAFCARPEKWFDAFANN